MGEYREIITKAVVAKGRKFTKSNHTICPAHNPCSILGCWIINHKYEAKKVGKAVEVCGYFDTNIWYSYNDNTKTGVATERITYKDVIKLKYRDPDCQDDLDIIVKVLQQPNCVEAVVSPNGNKVIVQEERELKVEVIGETKVWVAISHEKDESDDEEWGLDVDEEDYEELNPGFLMDHEEE